jgi:hypothetical protein
MVEFHAIRFATYQKAHYAWSSKSLISSAIADVSIRPLRTNTVNLPRSVVSILNVIAQTIRPTSQSRLGCTPLLPSEHEPQVVQLTSQSDLAENRALRES